MAQLAFARGDLAEAARAALEAMALNGHEIASCVRLARILLLRSVQCRGSGACDTPLLSTSLLRNALGTTSLNGSTHLAPDVEQLVAGLAPRAVGTPAQAELDSLRAVATVCVRRAAQLLETAESPHVTRMSAMWMPEATDLVSLAMDMEPAQ